MRISVSLELDTELVVQFKRSIASAVWVCLLQLPLLFPPSFPGKKKPLPASIAPGLGILWLNVSAKILSPEVVRPVNTSEKHTALGPYF